uniref:MTOR-associated protein MEAK7 n=1 Tax=Plectus sambesii TaxID=2011161 RepID=A0A914W7V8_9BILA
MLLTRPDRQQTIGRRQVVRLHCQPDGAASSHTCAPRRRQIAPSARAVRSRWFGRSRWAVAALFLHTNLRRSFAANPAPTLIRDLVSSYVLAESSSAEFQTWSFGPPERAKVELTEFLASELKSFAAADGSCSLHQLRKWMINSSVVLPLLDAVFRTAFELKLLDEEVNLRGFPMPTIPFCLGVDWRRMQSLLLVPSLFFLNQHLPNEHRRQWKLLFNSRVHGESFSKLANQTGGHGACVILVKSSDGCLFGAFASDGFVMGPSFVGDERSFLFTIEPRMAIYNATGYNNNFAYLNNHQQQMPNGLGMGGSIDSGFWSFFLDHDLDGRHSTQANARSASPFFHSTLFQ